MPIQGVAARRGGWRPPMHSRTIALLAAGIALAIAGVVGLSGPVSRTSAAPNLLTNPDFDDDISGWTPFEPAAWISTEDSTSNPTSGALEFRIPVPGPLNSGGVQCIPVTASTAYVASGDVKIRTLDQPAGTSGGFSMVFFDGASCTGNQIGFDNISDVTAIDDAW